MITIVYECQECGHEEEREAKKVLGEDPTQDDYEIQGEGEVTECAQCGSLDIDDHWLGVRGRDEGREDFHSDG